MPIKLGDIVQIWSETEYKCLGWGTVVATVFRESNSEEIPLIQLEDGNRKVWGSEVFWIEEKKAIEIGLNVFKAIHKK